MSSALDDVRGRRAGLRAAMDELERAIAAPGGGRHAVWVRGVRVAVETLGAALEKHVTATEAEGGLLDDVLHSVPRLAHRIDQLRDEHQSLLAATDAVAKALAGDEASVSVDQIRDDVVSLLGGLVRHRHRGAELVYDAYNVDIEAAD